jgi:hypothetical protein
MNLLLEIVWKTTAIAAPIVFLVLVRLWMDKKRQIGIVRCRRCFHEGLVAGRWLPWRGVIAVCEVCHGDYWTKIEPKA